MLAIDQAGNKLLEFIKTKEEDARSRSRDHGQTGKRSRKLLC